MFQFPAFAPRITGVPESLPVGCPIRKSTDHGIFAPLRGLSQLVTSFFASESQGIPHAPLVDSVISSCPCTAALLPRAADTVINFHD